MKDQNNIIYAPLIANLLFETTMQILYCLSLTFSLLLPLIQSVPTMAPTLQPWAAYMGLADRCPMVKHPSAAVKQALTSVLIGQDHGK